MIAIINMVSGCTNASTGANTVGKRKPAILSGKSPMKPLVIKPSITAQQAAERILTMKLGFAFLVIVAICFLIWLLKTNRAAERASLARSRAMAIRAKDANRIERQNWIDANCDLAGQVAALRAENEQYKKTLAMAGIDDVAEFKKWLAERK